MGKYVAKRLLALIPTLLVIVLIILLIMDLTPGDPARIILGDKASPEAVAKLTEQMKLNRPFIMQYADYVIGLLKGDLGNSYRTGRPVFNEIIVRLPTTARLALYGMIIAILVGVPLGILAAVKQYSFFDVMGTASSMLMASIPGFWLGLMLIYLFGLELGWLPTNGIDSWKGYILPSCMLAIPEAAILLRMTRTTMLETIRQDYIRTARSKGQKEQSVIFIHALKNALLPVITVAGMDFGFMLGGAVVSESVFSINGVGKLILDSIRMKDIPQVTGCAVLLAFFFMLIMLIVDILYAVIDPRIKAQYQRR